MKNLCSLADCCGHNGLLLGLILLTLPFSQIYAFPQSQAPGKNPLPLPSSMPLATFEQQVFDFLNERKYESLNWARDKGIRPTGPFIDGKSYNNHPAVRIYYSPGIIKWLVNGRSGPIPQNAMIIKEMHNAPAQQYYIDSTLSYDNKDLIQSNVDAGFSAWTIMIRDTAGAHDGWYWGFVFGDEASQKPDTNMFEYPDQGFGQYCTRCHASAADQLTFSALSNIEGFDGDPISYTNDASWIKRQTTVHAELMSSHQNLFESDEFYNTQIDESATASRSQTHAEFVKYISGVEPPPLAKVVNIPPVGYDHVVSQNGTKEQFITSDQCLGCHSGFQAVTGWEMFNVADKDTANLSPYGEWRWSMMGLAGRDPVFFAQQESERILQPKQADLITDLCFRCHGVMGQRQFHLDNSGNDKLFREEFVFSTPATDATHAKYGALARDGISCLVCHQMVDDGASSIFPIETGQFKVGSPDTLHGPYELVAAHAMQESIGITPVYNPYIKSSRVCGSCHTVHLPVFNAAGEQVGDRFEQTTYLEWLNSAYSNENSSDQTTQDSQAYAGEVMPKSCQDCHMPQTYHGRKLGFKVATIEDQDYPFADHLAPMENITVRNRSEYSRHTLLGVNVFVMEMFNQFDDILGVRLSDYMSGRSDGLERAIKNADELAKFETAQLDLNEVKRTNSSVDVKVRVQNLVGHKFPSGVGFRRAFLRVELLDTRKNLTLWASGRTNAVGAIVDENKQALPSEFFEEINGKQVYEPHYELIDKQNQVQIYQELALNPEGKFTTSFVAIDQVPKDNRLLPRGWNAKGPSHELTEPEGRAAQDPLYQNGSGADELVYRIPLPRGRNNNLEVHVSLFYQSIPPFYLRDRFTTEKDGKRAIDGDDTQRLLYLASHIDYSNTPADGWVIQVGMTQKLAL